MRTNDIKALAEEMQDDYEEELRLYVKNGGDEMKFPDIFSWVSEQEATKQEEHNDYIRDEGIADD